MPDFNRRSSDTEDPMLKLVRLESDLDHWSKSLDSIGDRLDVYITNNSKIWDELKSHMQNLATASEIQALTSRQQAETMAQLSTTLMEMSKNDSKIQSLEEFRVRTNSHLEFCDKDRKAVHDELTKTTELTMRLYWLAPIVLLLIQGAWEVLTHFKIL